MNAYVARQPIFDKRMNVFAYELLFRQMGGKNEFDNSDGDRATSHVIADSFLLIGLDELTRGKKVFINFTQNLLADETPASLPKNMLVIEILETVLPERGIITACMKLKKMGYVLALDDFVFEDKYLPLLELADIVKVDFLISPPEERRAIIERFGPKGIKFLAEKVETREMFDEALKLGYTYFQGFFFSKPVIVSHKDISGYKINFMSILREVNRPVVNFNEIENTIKLDVSISYKLLRFINSSFFSFNTKIHSIKQALTLLGILEFRKWVSLIILKGMGSDKPEELMVASVVRAQFCELIGKTLLMREKSADLFLMGLFSLIDVFTDRPMNSVMEQLPLGEDIQGALLGYEGTFRNILNLVVAYETIDQEGIRRQLEVLQLDLPKVADCYLKAVTWANQLLTA